MRLSNLSCWRSNHCSISRDSVAGTRSSRAPDTPRAPSSCSPRRRRWPRGTDADRAPSADRPASPPPAARRCGSLRRAPHARESASHTPARLRPDRLRSTPSPASPTLRASLPIARVPTTGFSASRSRSHTGARFQFTPIVRASRAVRRAARRSASMSPSAVIAASGGNPVAPANCCPAPRSSSAAISNGCRDLSCSSFASARTPSCSPPTS